LSPSRYLFAICHPQRAFWSEKCSAIPSLHCVPEKKENSVKAIAQSDRVRAHTSARTNWEIDATMRRRVEVYAHKGPEAIKQRIEELEREWDIERTLELNASTIALTGLLLGLSVNKKWLIVPGLVLPFLLQHAVQGWCPPLPLLRNWGFRSREEIDSEKYALKALRGDFAQATDASAALDAAKA
jgi:hypothetical protein